MKNSTKYVIACSAVLLLSGCVLNYTNRAANPDQVMPISYDNHLLPAKTIPKVEPPSVSDSVKTNSPDSNSNSDSYSHSASSKSSDNSATNPTVQTASASNAAKPAQPTAKPQSQDPQEQRIQNQLKTLTTLIINKKSLTGTIQVGVSKTYNFTLQFNNFSQASQTFAGTLSIEGNKAPDQFAGTFAKTTLEINEMVNLPGQTVSYTREIILNPDGNGHFSSDWNYDDYYQDNIKATINF